MGKTKYLCSKCGNKHFPPTGKKCVFREPEDSNTNGQKTVKLRTRNKKGSSLVHAARASTSKSDTLFSDSDMSSAKEMDSTVDSQSETSDTEHRASTQDAGRSTTQNIQEQILKELQSVSSRLEVVENKVAETSTTTQGPKDTHKLSSFSKTKQVHKHCKHKKFCYSSESESEDSDVPDLAYLRSNKRIQKKVDDRIAELEKNFETKGKSEKLKSKRGGSVEVLVEKRVAWPHDVILGGQNRTRVTYDQLSLTQFAQGFIKNVLEEKSEKIREKMLSYFADLMEDATDFSWANAKAANAVILCEMERGRLTWEDSDRLDRLRRAHAQKHSFQKSQNWARGETKKPWYCKSFQAGLCFHNKDHENGGKLYRHICAFCLRNGRQLPHSEKECTFAKKQPKNELVAALQ